VKALEDKDREDGKVTIGPISQVTFKLESGKECYAYWNGYSWEQYGGFLIDPDVLDATFNELQKQGYITEGVSS
jgi:hypothetical protein